MWLTYLQNSIYNMESLLAYILLHTHNTNAHKIKQIPTIMFKLYTLINFIFYWP